MQTRANGWRLRRLGLEMLIALSLAFLVWLYMHSRDQNTIDHVQIPVRIKLTPAQRDLFSMEIVGDAKVTASFSGPGSRLREFRRRLQKGLVQVEVTLTLSDEKLNENTSSEIVRIEPAHIAVPPGVQVDLAEDTRAIQVTLHRLIDRILPVRMDFSGDAKVSQLKVEPSTVLVRGPKAVLDRAEHVSTQPYVLTVPPEGSAEQAVRGQATLAGEIDGRAVLTNPKLVSFRCKVESKHKVYEVNDIPVLFLCPPQLPYRPRFASDQAGKISVRLVGPASDVKPPVLAFVELTGTNLARGRNLEPVRLQLPKDFTLVHNSSPVIAFFLDE